MNRSDLMGVLGIAVGLLAVIVAVLYGRRHAQLVYVQEGDVILDATQLEEDVEVRWRGDPVPYVSRTTITIWNAGSLPLDGASIVSGYPLRFRFRGRVLAAETLRRSREENDFEVAADPKQPDSVLMQFKYLDPRHGAAFQVVHASGVWGARPEGTVKGINTAIVVRAKGLPLPGPVVASVAIGAGLAGLGSPGIRWWRGQGFAVSDLAIGVAAAAFGIVTLLLSVYFRPPRALRS